MRKRLGIILAVGGLTVLMMVPVVKAGGIGIGGTLGYVSLNMGDLQDWYGDKVANFDDWGYTFTGRDFKNNILFGADGKFALSENLMLRMDYSRLSASQTIEITDPVSAKDSCQVSAHAIAGSLILAVPLSPFRAYGGAGAALYLAQCTITDEYGTEQYVEKGSGSAVGFQGFVGTEIFLGKNLSVSLEALYRMAKLSSINCTESTKSPDSIYDPPSTVGEPLKRHTDYPSLMDYKDLELDFGGFSFLVALHAYF